MRFTMYGFSQIAGLELNLSPNDLLILRWFVDFKNTGKMHSMTIDGEEYYYVSHQAVVDDLPILYMKADTVYRHFSKMCKEKVLKRQIVYRNGKLSYYAFGENFPKLEDFDFIKEFMKEHNTPSVTDNEITCDDEQEEDKNIGSNFDDSDINDTESSPETFESNSGAFESYPIAFESNRVSFESSPVAFEFNIGVFKSNFNAFKSNLGVFKSDLGAFKFRPSALNPESLDKKFSPYTLNPKLTDKKSTQIINLLYKYIILFYQKKYLLSKISFSIFNHYCPKGLRRRFFYFLGISASKFGFT